MTIELAQDNDITSIPQTLANAALYTPQEPTEADRLRQQVAYLKAALTAADKENAEFRKLAPYASLIDELKALVATEVSNIVQNTNMLAVLSAEHEERIREIVADAITEHTDEYDHDDYDNLEERIREVERDVENVPSQHQVEEMVSDAMGELDIDREVSDAIDNIDLGEKIEEYLSTVTLSATLSINKL